MNSIALPQGEPTTKGKAAARRNSAQRNSDAPNSTGLDKELAYSIGLGDAFVLAQGEAGLPSNKKELYKFFDKTNTVENGRLNKSK